MLDEARMMGKVLLRSVLKDKESVLLEQALRKDDVGQFGQLRQGVGRIGKDEVELLAALRHELKGITAYGQACLVLKLVEKLLDEAMVSSVKLHANDATATSADEFERDASRAGEEVESCRLLAEVDVGLQDIEEILLGKVRRGPCREATGHVEVPAFVFACDDSHVFTLRLY